ncbi:MAG: penicillin-binding protein 1A [Ottowia sp.]|nr:penicillin-binding protein 1A [Ottowia sp.]
MNSPSINEQPSKKTWWTHTITTLFGLALAGLIVIALILAYALIVAQPNLPSIEGLVDYRPKIPLRVYSADHVLIGEFGDERRNLTRIQDIPEIMKRAVLAIEDARFYTHSGVDYIGVLRAVFSHLRGGMSQGASTITMQVARNFFLTREKTLTRKLYELLLANKIEARLTKDQILELYMNQIYLGQRAYGFASAAQIYFGKPLKDITLAEAAMLAGLPKAPSAYNPVTNPKRAHIRQQYILQRMHELRYITTAQYEHARKEVLHVRGLGNEFATRADYAAEMVRQLLYAQYKDEIYTRGLSVTTTIIKSDQEAAYAALRRGVLDYDKRHGYRGPEAFITLSANNTERQNAIEELLVEHPDSDNMQSAVVIEASPRGVRAVTTSEDAIHITGEGLRLATWALSAKAQPKLKIRPGALIRIVKNQNGLWEITQMPEVEAAFIAINPEDGAIRALVGGFDFQRNQFNHVTLAWRQPGSSFKPFIYSAALERGFWPGTIINDAPLSFSATQTGSQVWEPKNYDGKFDGPLTMRRALAKSKNMVSIRILEAITPKYAQEYIQRFGFDADRHPAYLTMALGAGSVTPMQMSAAYAIFANGGYPIHPYLIQKIEDAQGKVLAEVQPQNANLSMPRAIDQRNVFIMDSLLKEVARTGTAASTRQLGRNDIAGKTGTTNDSVDAWFAGYTPKLVAVAWMGYDTPRSLGERETGGGATMPIWINYMKTALKGMPETDRPMPPGIVQSDNDWIYEEYLKNHQAINTLGLDDASTPSGHSETQKILDFFR